MSYDSKTDTLLHIKRVAELLSQGATELLCRGIVHDNSKLGPDEKPYFDKYTPLLAKLTYGSPEYKQALDELKPALIHHYQNNSHHPEYYKTGVNGMDLFDLIEMFFDWKAAGERHDNGNIYKSIEINKKRFNLSDQLVDILVNTAVNLRYARPADGPQGQQLSTVSCDHNYQPIPGNEQFKACTKCGEPYE